MKTFRLLIATAVAVALGQSAFAGVATKTFDVTVNLTAACTVTGGPYAVSLNYTAFGAQQQGTTTPTISCTRGVAPSSIQFDGTNGTSATASAASNAGITGEGVVNGLRYTLSAPAIPAATAGTAASAGNNGTSGSDGTADTISLPITVTFGAGQAGTGPGGSATQTRTLTVNF